MSHAENLRIPPHSPTAEQAVLGAILNNNDLLDAVTPILSEDDFYSRSHRLIYCGIAEMLGSGRAVDLITLPEFLSHKNWIDDVGGDTYVYELARSVPSTANLMTYTNTVRNRSLQRQAIAAAHDIQEQCYNSDGSDVIEILGNAEKRLGDVSEKLCTNEADYSIHAALQTAIDELETRINSGSEIAGISTGLSDLDNKINGLEPADMIVLAARPSMGKTTLAMNMVTTEAIRGGKPIVFSMEMPRQQLIYKMISSLGQVSIADIQRPSNSSGGMTDEKFSRVSSVMCQLKQTHLSIVDDAYMTIPRMRLELRRYQKKHGKPTLIMADYLQLIRGHRKTDNRVNEISEISRDIKALAKEFDCPFLVLSQLSRSLESRNNKRPINSDLRESGQIEQDADKIIFIYRDEVYNENSQDRGLAEIIIGKCRMGEIGMVGSVFRGEYSEFKPLANRQIVGDVPAPRQTVRKFEG
ncbi:replicative DNA helicase [Alteromonas sp. IB21]|uniref:replicative DNA helicase n=1 Tax=Alteromonas sp. IB21 TaxID=2779369 RepID=UPI0018E702F3|nr:replicative DNA helicase [Alteromonas sp. IB21]MBJ2129087.1 replicative DNA helicase [Alteromonas sp. IB21]